MSTPLVRMTKERRAEKALRREKYAKADAAIPLVYLARFSGRPGHITVGKTTTNGDGSMPRLGDHTRGAGQLEHVTWVKGGHETETRLHRELREEQLNGEPSWFAYSYRVEAYEKGLETWPHMATTDHLKANSLDYLKVWPVSGASVGQIDVFGNVVPAAGYVEDLDDYATPPLFAEAVRLTLRGIALDPCTSDRVNNETIRADTNFVAEEARSGLLHPWKARNAYVNPPWSQDGVWARRLEQQIAEGNLAEAIFAIGDTALSKAFWADFGPYPMAQAVGRPGWREWTGEIAPPCGGVFVYLGGDKAGEQRFHRVFSCVAHVYGRRKMTAYRGGSPVPAKRQWDLAEVERFWRYWTERTKDFS